MGMSELSGSARARVDDIVQARVSSGDCPSVSSTLFIGDQVLYRRGVGETTLGGSAPDLDTVYRIASVTKGFTAATVMILRDRGLVQLDTPITTYVPEFRQVEGGPQYGAPTVRMLMAMSGGLPTDDPWADRQESISSQELRDFVAGGVYLTSAPGTAFQYSNLGYALLGQVIEGATGRGFRDVIRDEVLVPLGLTSTGFEETVVSAERLARGYRQGPDGWEPLEFSGPGAFSCIGGLFSSARDLSRWVNWLAEALLGSTSTNDILSLASRREMQQIATVIPFETSQWVDDKPQRVSGYGFGLMAEYDPVWGQFVSHSGGYPGFGSHIRWHVPTGLGVVVLENSTYARAMTTATTMLEVVLSDRDFRVAPVEPWPQTKVMAERAVALLLNWEEATLDELFEPNVNMDVPYAERRAQIDDVLASVGGLETTSITWETATSDSPAQLVWTMPGQRGAVQCEIRLSPIRPSRIQTFRVSKIY